MDKLKDLKSRGWHPEEKHWRDDFKGLGQVAGWMGKGQGTDTGADSPNASRATVPLSKLKDPSSFGPPPKHTGYYGTSSTSPSTGGADAGLGAPVVLKEEPKREGQGQQQQQTAKQEVPAGDAAGDSAVDATAKPAGPFKIDTTGLSTAGLPKPPLTRREEKAESPQRARIAATTNPNPNPKLKPKPKLPPRLPPRRHDPAAQTPPPSYDDSVPLAPDGAAVNRLGAAGISVPELGIGQEAQTPAAPAPAPAPSSSANAPPKAHANVRDIQTRLAGLSAISTPPESPNVPKSAVTAPPPPPMKTTTAAEEGGRRGEEGGSVGHPSRAVEQAKPPPKPTKPSMVKLAEGKAPPPPPPPKNPTLGQKPPPAGGLPPPPPVPLATKPH